MSTLGYDYESVYKKGSENAFIDALSQKFKEPMALQAISFPVLNWIDQVKQEWLEDNFINSYHIIVTIRYYEFEGWISYLQTLLIKR